MLLLNQHFWSRDSSNGPDHAEHCSSRSSPSKADSFVNLLEKAKGDRPRLIAVRQIQNSLSTHTTRRKQPSDGRTEGCSIEETLS